MAPGYADGPSPTQGARTAAVRNDCGRKNLAPFFMPLAGLDERSKHET